MQRITIERYPDSEQLGYAGFIEGTRDDGSTWIMWLDDAGSPAVFWGQREPDGAVIGEGVDLSVRPVGLEPTSPT